MRDHEVAKLVNDLRDITIEFHGAQQLRERIAQRVKEALTADEPLTWQSITPAYARFITDSRYRKLSQSMREWYRPICLRCASIESEQESKT